jgi:hypothetical protein
MPPLDERLKKAKIENLTEVVFVDHEKFNFFSEKLFCSGSGDKYIVMEIPHILKGITVGDQIEARFDETDKTYYWERTLRRSGGSTIKVKCFVKEAIDKMTRKLEKIGCTCRTLLAGNRVAVNIPKEVNYKTVIQYLDIGRELDKWAFEVLHKGHAFELNNRNKDALSLHVEIAQEKVGCNLRKHRQRREFTIFEAAEKSGVSEWAITDMENGDFSKIGLGPFLILCSLYGADPGATLK